MPVAPSLNISIVTPSYRQLPWLKLCAASIADQQGVAVEHIIQDAGSGAELEEWVRQNTTAQLHVERDKNMYDGVNRGLRRARGDICAYLNCDEQYLPGVLERVAGYFEQHPRVEVLFGDTIVVDSSLAPLFYRRAVLPRRWHTLLCPLSIYTCSTFFRRKLIDEGIFFDEAWKTLGDKSWVLRLLQRGYRLALLREPMSIFTLTGANLSRQPDLPAERRLWRSDVSPLLRALTPFVRLHHWGRKWWTGAYRPFVGDLSYYRPDDLKHRAHFTRLTLSPFWPNAATHAVKAMKANTTPPDSYQSRFLDRDVAEDYACREYGADSYASAVWKSQAPVVEGLLRGIRQEDPAGRHLDFACGAGRITRLAEAAFDEVDAVDISPAMVELAQAASPRARFFVGNILENPELCPGPYASITAFRLLLNLDPSLRRPILTGLNRRLKPGGVLLLNLHGNRHSLRQPAILWKRWRRGPAAAKDGLMLNDMSRKEVERCLEASAFLVERLYGTGVLPPTVYRWPFRSLWSRMDGWLSGRRFLLSFCIDLIFVCRKKESPAS